MNCPLCQYEFDETHQACHGRCPLASVQGCHLICCPNCGYQMVDEKRSQVARLLRLLLPAEPKTSAPEPGPAPRA